jgi:hypothetical protein
LKRIYTLPGNDHNDVTSSHWAPPLKGSPTSQ